MLSPKRFVTYTDLRRGEWPHRIGVSPRRSPRALRRERPARADVVLGDVVAIYIDGVDEPPSLTATLWGRRPRRPRRALRRERPARADVVLGDAVVRAQAAAVVRDVDQPPSGLTATAVGLSPAATVAGVLGESAPSAPTSYWETSSLTRFMT